MQFGAAVGLQTGLGVSAELGDAPHPALVYLAVGESVFNAINVGMCLAQRAVQVGGDFGRGEVGKGLFPSLDVGLDLLEELAAAFPRGGCVFGEGPGVGVELFDSRGGGLGVGDGGFGIVNVLEGDVNFLPSAAATAVCT